jgi:hypothetical protein
MEINFSSLSLSQEIVHHMYGGMPALTSSVVTEENLKTKEPIKFKLVLFK